MQGIFSLCSGTFLMFVIFALIVLVPMMVVIVYEYERAILFRLGKYVRVLGPGLRIILPVIDRVVKIDVREQPMEVPPQEIITKDNVTVRINAVVFFKVYDADKAFIEVSDYYGAVLQLAQTTLRNVIGQSDLDEILIHREELNEKIRQIVDQITERWGIKITVVEIKDIELPDTMKRAMARQAEAERERRAKVIHAEGEYQAAERLTEAAKIMASNPYTLQLRFLQVLQDIAVEKNSTIVFPVPIELISVFSQVNSKNCNLNSHKSDSLEGED